MTMTRNLIKFGRKQLHTVVSRELIKPSSPTPSHLKTYNLTLVDQFMVRLFMPMVTFYPNTGTYRSSHDKTLALKNSLSQTLTKYYPFAGRYEFDKVAPAYVDCNDNEADFFEATIDRTLSDFLHNSQHEDYKLFFPHGLNYNYDGKREDDDLQSNKVTPLTVQVNHFECGGLAVAVSISHKIADGCSLVHFIDDWAQMSRFCTSEKKHEPPTDPKFISFEYRNIKSGGIWLERSKDCVTRSFMFPNSKLNELKLKVKAMTAESEQPITNPTRLEVLNWLLHNRAVSASTKNNSGSFRPTCVCHVANLRDKMIEPLPEKSIGNYIMGMFIPTKNESDMKPESFISELKKQKLQLKGIRNIETVVDLYSKVNLEEMQGMIKSGYTFTSLCGYPAYEIDFGWGKPIKTTMPGFSWNNNFILMDAPNKDGIEALVSLGKQDMDIFQNDLELLAYTRISESD